MISIVCTPASVAMEVPTFIPPDGLILPIELKPWELAETNADIAAARRFRESRSRGSWLEGKFGISAADGLVKSQLNYCRTSARNYIGLGLGSVLRVVQGREFRLLMRDRQQRGARLGRRMERVGWHRPRRRCWLYGRDQGREAAGLLRPHRSGTSLRWQADGRVLEIVLATPFEG